MSISTPRPNPLTRALSLFAIAALSSLVLSVASGDDSTAAEKPHGRLFEMRVYTTAEGKLDNLHDRFRDHTNQLFVKHGMSLIAYWTPQEKPNTLIYILAYPDRAARDRSWEAFMDDPVWKQVWADSKKNAGGAIVTKVESTFMTPTDYSPIQ